MIRMRSILEVADNTGVKRASMIGVIGEHGKLWAKVGDSRRLSVTFGVPRGFDIDFNLLGRRDLFRRYVVSFDDTHEQLTFAPHSHRT